MIIALIAAQLLCMMGCVFYEIIWGSLSVKAMQRERDEEIEYQRYISHLQSESIGSRKQKYADDASEYEMHEVDDML